MRETISIYKKTTIRKNMETNENLGDLKWTRFPDKQKEEAAKYKAEEIMEIYLDPDASADRKQWCRDMMTVKYERYIYQLIHTSFHTFCPAHIKEFFNCGVIGLIKAMNANYDGKHSFTTYCKGYINHELSRLAGHLLHGQSSHYALIYKKVLRAQSELRARGIEPTAALISILADIPESSVKKALDVQQRTDFVYLDGLDDSSYISETYETPEKICMEKEELQAIHAAIKSLSPERAEIVKRVFGICTDEQDFKSIPDKGMKYKEISDLLGIPINRVKSELNAAINEFRVSEAFGDSYRRICSRSRRDLNQIDVHQPSHDELINEMESTAAAIFEFEDGNEADLSAAFEG